MIALPTPRTPDPMRAPSLRWGIFGPGWVAGRFTAALRGHTTQRITGVASTNLDRARKFAETYQIPTATGDYGSLAARDDVDAVYVATTHPQHLDAALVAIAAGKHVVVEKPLAVSAAQARQLADAARAANVLCLEAMWPMFLPRYDVVRQVLEEGLLGEVSAVFADHGEWFPADHRIQRADLGGGPLLDLGTYVVNFAQFILGNPTAVHANGTQAESGVLGQASIALEHGPKEQSLLHTTILAGTPTTATVAGTHATLFLSRSFYQPGPVELVSKQQRVSWYEPPIEHAGLYSSAVEAARCIGEGLIESPLYPNAAAISVLDTLDQVASATAR